MATLVIHVGQGKAASTSLQKALAAKRLEMDRCGVSYPDTGRSSHAAEAAWFATTYGQQRAHRAARSFRNNLREQWHPDWGALVSSVEQHPMTIISSEFFSQYGPRLATAAVHSLTGDRPLDVRVVIVARLVSRLLPSQYGQMARDFPLPAFDTWVRLQLRALAAMPSQAPSEQRNAMDSRWLATCWSQAAQVRVVDFDPPTGLDFEQDLLSALLLDGVLSPPFLGHSNSGGCAARTIAWQRVMSRDGRPDHPRRLGAPIPFEPFADSDLPGGGGRFQLTPAAAQVVDAAFPRPGSAALASANPATLARDLEAARTLLTQLIMSSEPLTYVAGVDTVELAEGVSYCLRHLPWEPARP